MNLDADPWINRRLNRRHPTPIQLHALGTVTYYWNQCEESLRCLFVEVSQIPQRLEHIMAHDVGDVVMVEKVRALAKRRRFGSELTQSLAHACEMYDRCRLNRNALVHSKVVSKKTGPHLAALHKKSGDMIVVAEDITTIRRVVEEISDCTHFILDLCFHIGGGNRRKWPLPQVPALPEKIAKPPPSAPPQGKRPPRSSPP